MCIFFELIPWPPQGAKNIDEELHSVFGTVVSHVRHLVISCPCLKWDCPDGFQREYYPLLATWVGDYPEQLMVPQVSYVSCPLCKTTKGLPMRHSSCRPLDNTRDQHVYSELLEVIIIDALHTLGVHPIRAQFWQYSLCNVYRHWQPDELHQRLLGLVNNLLHWLLKYLTARDVKDQGDNRFTLVKWYPGHRHFSKPFDSLESGSWPGEEIGGMIRTRPVNCTPIVDISKDDGKIAAENASDEMVMGAVWTLCEFSGLVRQQNHSNLSLKALDDALKPYWQKNFLFR